MGRRMRWAFLFRQPLNKSGIFAARGRALKFEHRRAIHRSPNETFAPWPRVRITGEEPSLPCRYNPSGAAARPLLAPHEHLAPADSMLPAFCWGKNAHGVCGCPRRGPTIAFGVAVGDVGVGLLDVGANRPLFDPSPSERELSCFPAGRSRPCAASSPVSLGNHVTVPPWFCEAFPKMETAGVASVSSDLASALVVGLGLSRRAEPRSFAIPRRAPFAPPRAAGLRTSWLAFPAPRPMRA